MKKGLQLQYLRGVNVPVQRGKAKKCAICTKDFGVFNQEHQCKRCKRPVCDKCSPYKALTLKKSGPSKQPHRQCTLCKEESDSMKKLVEQQKVLFLQDSYSTQWLKSFGFDKLKADKEYEQAQKEEQHNKTELNKMKQQSEQVFLELLSCYNYSLREFFYLTLKDIEIAKIQNAIMRVLGTFLQAYPEVGYSADQFFLTLFLLCFSSESAAYTLLTLLYAEMIPSHIYPSNSNQYDYQNEIDKLIVILQQVFKIKDNMKPFLMGAIKDYLQPLTLNFFLFETTFFIWNQMFSLPKQAYDDLIKSLAAVFSLDEVKKAEDSQLIILRVTKASLVQSAYFQTNKFDLRPYDKPVVRRSAIISRQKTIVIEQESDGKKQQQLQIEIENLHLQIDQLKQVIERQSKLDTLQGEKIAELELQLSQLTSLMVPDGDELQEMHRATIQVAQNNPNNIEVQKLKNYIDRLEHSLMIEHRINEELKNNMSVQVSATIQPLDDEEDTQDSKKRKQSRKQKQQKQLSPQEEPIQEGPSLLHQMMEKCQNYEMQIQEMTRLISETNKITESLGKKEQEIEALTLENASQNAKLTQYSETIITMSSELSDYKLYSDDLEAQVKSFTIENDKLKVRYETQIEQITADNKAQLFLLEGQIQQLTDQSSDNLAQSKIVQELKQQVASLQMSLDLSKQKESHFESLLYDQDQVQKDLKEQLRVTKEKFEVQSELLQGEILEEEQELESLQLKYQSSMDKQKEQTNHYESQISDLTMQLEAIQQLQKEHQSILEIKAQEIKKLNDEKLSLDDKLTKMESQNHQYEQQIKDAEQMNEDYSKLQDKYKLQSKDIELLKLEFAKVNSNKQEIDFKLDDLNAKCKELEDQNSILKIELQNQQEVCNKQIEQQKYIESQLQEQLNLVSQSSEEAFLQIQENNTLLQQQIKDKNVEIENNQIQCKKEFKESKEEYTTLEEQSKFEREQLRINHLKEIEIITQNHNELNEKHHELNQKHKEVTIQLEYFTDESARQKNQIQSNLLIIQEFEKLQEKHKLQKDELDLLIIELSQVKEQKEQLQEQVNLMSQNQNEAFQDIQKQNTLYEEQIHNKDQIMEANALQIIELTQQIQSQIQENSQLSEKIQQTEIQLNESKEEQQTLEEQGKLEREQLRINHLKEIEIITQNHNELNDKHHELNQKHKEVTIQLEYFTDESTQQKDQIQSNLLIIQEFEALQEKHKLQKDELDSLIRELSKVKEHKEQLQEQVNFMSQNQNEAFQDIQKQNTLYEEQIHNKDQIMEANALQIAELTQQIKSQIQENSQLSEKIQQTEIQLNESKEEQQTLEEQGKLEREQLRINHLKEIEIITQNHNELNYKHHELNQKHKEVTIQLEYFTDQLAKQKEQLQSNLLIIQEFEAFQEKHKLQKDELELFIIELSKVKEHKEQLQEQVNFMSQNQNEAFQNIQKQNTLYEEQIHNKDQIMEANALQIAELTQQIKSQIQENSQLSEKIQQTEIQLNESKEEQQTLEEQGKLEREQLRINHLKEIEIITQNHNELNDKHHELNQKHKELTIQLEYFTDQSAKQKEQLQSNLLIIQEFEAFQEKHKLQKDELDSLIIELSKVKEHKEQLQEQVNFMSQNQNEMFQNIQKQNTLYEEQIHNKDQIMEANALQIAELTQQIKSQIQENSQLSEKIQQTEIQLNESKEEQQTFEEQGKLEREQLRINHLKQIEIITQNHNELNDKHHELNQKHKEVTIQLEYFTDQSAKQKEQLQSNLLIIQEFEAFQEKHKLQKDELDSLIIELSKVKEHKEQLQEQVNLMSSNQNEAFQNIQKQNTLYEEQIHNKDQIMEANVLQITELTQQIKSQIQVNSQLSEKIQETEIQLNESKEEYQTLEEQSKLEREQLRINHLKEIEIITQNHNELSDKHQELNQKHKEVTIQLDYFTDQSAKQKGQLQSNLLIIQEFEAFQEKHKVQKDELDSLIIELSKVKEQKEQLQEQVNLMSSNQNEAFQNIQKQNTQYEEQIHNNDQIMEANALQITELTQQIKSQIQENSQLSEKIQQTEIQLNESKEEQQTLEEQGKLERKQLRINHLNEIEIITVNHNELNDKHQELNQKHKEVTIQLGYFTDQSAKQKEQLQSNLLIIQEFEAFQEKHKLQKDELDSLIIELSKVKEHKEQLQEQVNFMSQNQNEMFQNIQKQNTLYEEQIHNKDQIMEANALQIIELTQQIKSQIQENSQLSEKIQQIEIQLNESKEEQQTLEEQGKLEREQLRINHLKEIEIITQNHNGLNDKHYELNQKHKEVTIQLEYFTDESTKQKDQIQSNLLIIQEFETLQEKHKLQKAELDLLIIELSKIKEQKEQLQEQVNLMSSNQNEAFQNIQKQNTLYEEQNHNKDQIIEEQTQQIQAYISTNQLNNERIQQIGLQLNESHENQKTFENQQIQLKQDQDTQIMTQSNQVRQTQTQNQQSQNLTYEQDNQIGMLQEDLFEHQQRIVQITSENINLKEVIDKIRLVNQQLSESQETNNQLADQFEVMNMNYNAEFDQKEQQGQFLTAKLQQSQEEQLIQQSQLIEQERISQQLQDQILLLSQNSIEYHHEIQNKLQTLENEKINIKQQAQEQMDQQTLEIEKLNVSHRELLKKIEEQDQLMQDMEISIQELEAELAISKEILKSQSDSQNEIDHFQNGHSSEEITALEELITESKSIIESQMNQIRQQEEDLEQKNTIIQTLEQQLEILNNQPKVIADFESFCEVTFLPIFQEILTSDDELLLQLKQIKPAIQLFIKEHSDLQTNLEISVQQYQDQIDKLKQRDRHILEQFKDQLKQIHWLNEQEIFSFADNGRYRRTRSILDEEDIRSQLEACNHQITSLKALLVQKQDQLGQLHGRVVMIRDLLEEQFMKQI